MKLDLIKVKSVEPKIGDNALKVLSKMEIDKEYSFEELGCKAQTLDSLLIRNCIKHVGAAMLPSRKIGKFKISHNLLDGIKYMDDLRSGKIQKQDIIIGLNNLKNI
jgi:hypothetical protein